MAQKIRKFLLLMLLLLFPITIFYYSPYLVIIGALQGIVTGSLIVFGLQFLVSLFLGRAHCGWFCPAGGLQETVGDITGKKAKNNRANLLKYVIWTIWFSVIIYALWKSSEVKIRPFFMTEYGISVAAPEAYFILYGVILLLLVTNLVFGNRAACHYLCWMAPFMVLGMRLNRVLHLPRLHLKFNADQCVDCGKCRQVCQMDLLVRENLKDKKFVPECILCGKCVASCPTQAITYHFGSIKNGKN